MGCSRVNFTIYSKGVEVSIEYTSVVVLVINTIIIIIMFVKG